MGPECSARKITIRGPTAEPAMGTRTPGHQSNPCAPASSIVRNIAPIQHGELCGNRVYRRRRNIIGATKTRKWSRSPAGGEKKKEMARRGWGQKEEQGEALRRTAEETDTRSQKHAQRRKEKCGLASRRRKRKKEEE